jgi:phage gpG-like protein
MEIKINIAGEEKVLNILAETGRAASDLTMPFRDLGERLVRKVGQRIRGRVLKARSGRLSNSLTYDETARSLTVSAGGEPDVRYAMIHQKGGTIRAKNKKWLTIPFPGGPADRPVPLRASDFINTFVAKGIIFQKPAGKAKPIPLFILRKSVDMPARPYMYLEESDIAYLRNSVSEYLAGRWGKG